MKQKKIYKRYQAIETLSLEENTYNVYNKYILTSLELVENQYPLDIKAEGYKQYN